MVAEIETDMYVTQFVTNSTGFDKKYRNIHA
jgi:hypothetical protein